MIRTDGSKSRGRMMMFDAPMDAALDRACVELVPGRKLQRSEALRRILEAWVEAHPATRGGGKRDLVHLPMTSPRGSRPPTTTHPPPLAVDGPPMTGPEALTHPWRDEQDRLRAAAGARLFTARSSAGLSLRALGELIGVNNGTLSRAERGGLMPAKALEWVERQEAAKGGAG